jgi:hypothetical protein
MTERQELLKKLVVHGHLNVSERHALGSVGRQEVVGLVKTLLLAHDAFPLRIESKAIYEGAILRRTPSGAEITWRRAYPSAPFTIAESRTETFPDIDAAVRKFAETEWKSDIDGIKLG